MQLFSSKNYLLFINLCICNTYKIETLVRRIIQPLYCVPIFCVRLGNAYVDNISACKVKVLYGLKASCLKSERAIGFRIWVSIRNDVILIFYMFLVFYPTYIIYLGVPPYFQHCWIIFLPILIHRVLRRKVIYLAIFFPCIKIVGSVFQT